MRTKVISLSLLCLLLLMLCSCNKKDPSTSVPVKRTSLVEFQDKKILYLDSYHEEYYGNIPARAAFKKGIKNKGITVRYEFLDAKRVKDTLLLKKKAKEFQKIITQWTPDIIIAADDAVNKYVIVPYCKAQKIPVIFIGVNWSAEAYGYPTEYITGQLEVEQVEKLIIDLQKKSRGKRVGILSGNTLTDRKSIEYYKKILNLSFEKEILVDSFDEWKKEYLALSKNVDCIFLRSFSGIKGWDNTRAIEFIRTHTSVPTGTVNTKLEQYVLLSYPKLNQEFGEYAAATTLKILRGTSPGDIPVSMNKKTKLTINMGIAEKLGITFKPEVLDIAHLAGSMKRILFVNSYHKGYEWSDNIEKGFLNAMDLKPSYENQRHFIASDFEVKILQMDTKNNQTQSHLEKQTKMVLDTINAWKPHIIIASDDNASKYVIEPHFKDDTIPILFCGLNWDASVYGFPTTNITGMVEVAPVLELLQFLKKYSKGTRIGYIAADVISERKELSHYKNVLGIHFTDGSLVSTFDEWKKEYERLQKEVDLLVVLSYSGIEDWNPKEAETFVLQKSKIPTGSTSRFLRKLVLVAFTRIALEQGEWVGTKTKALLDGVAIADIPVEKNKRFTQFVNMRMAQKLGIRFESEILDSMILIEEE